MLYGLLIFWHLASAAIPPNPITKIDLSGEACKLLFDTQELFTKEGQIDFIRRTYQHLAETQKHTEGFPEVDPVLKLDATTQLRFYQPEAVPFLNANSTPAKSLKLETVAELGTFTAEEVVLLKQIFSLSSLRIAPSKETGKYEVARWIYIQGLFVLIHQR
jgi:hypothetical protein